MDDIWQGYASPVNQGDIWASVASPVSQINQNNNQPSLGMEHGVASNFAQGATFGLGDEAIAGTAALRSAFDNGRISGIPEDYNNALNIERGAEKSFQQDHPFISLGSQLAGGAATAIAGGQTAIGKAIASNLGEGGLPARMAKNALVGGISGGAYGFGSGQGGFENRLQSGQTGAEIGGGLGAALPVAGAALGALKGGGEAEALTNTSADAKSIASKFYTQAAKSGDTFEPEFTNSLIDKAASQAPQTLAGKATTGESPIADLASRWEALRDKPLDMQSIQEMDEGIGNLIDKEYSNGRLSKAGKQLLDLQSGFRNNVMDADVGEGGQALQDARQAWQQGAKMSDVERIFSRAEQSDNPATAIKSGVRTMLSNPARTRGWSDDEIQALKDAGDRGVFGGLLHVFGSRLGPLAGAAIGSAGGPIGAVVGGATTYGLSTGARNLASQMQMNRLQNVMDTLGQNVPQYVEQESPTVLPDVLRTIQGGR